jgi:hypothetical protein
MQELANCAAKIAASARRHSIACRARRSTELKRGDMECPQQQRNNQPQHHEGQQEAEHQHVPPRVLAGFEEITTGLQHLLQDFESLKRRLTSDRTLASFTSRARLRAMLSDMHRSASRLQCNLEHLRGTVVHVQTHKLCTNATLHLVQSLAELRMMCHEFAKKLHRLREITIEALEATRRQIRCPLRRIQIDCSALLVLVVYLAYVWIYGML